MTIPEAKGRTHDDPDPRTGWFPRPVLRLPLLQPGTFGLVRTGAPERQFHMTRYLHDAVLRNEAYQPAQYHTYLFVNAAEALKVGLHVDLRSAYTAIFLIGYVAVLSASWFWFAQMGYRVCGTTIGLSAIAAYAGILMCSVALYHPSDLYGTALFALALRGNAPTNRLGPGGVPGCGVRMGEAYHHRSGVAPLFWDAEGVVPGIGPGGFRARLGMGGAVGLRGNAGPSPDHTGGGLDPRTVAAIPAQVACLPVCLRGPAPHGVGPPVAGRARGPPRAPLLLTRPSSCCMR